MAILNVVRLDLWVHPCFDQMLRQHPGIHLEVAHLAETEEQIWEKLSRADVYHVSAAKDEVPLAYQVTADLLARCPELKVVSSTGSGYDTIDVAACTAAGVLVVNQAGGNAQSVAEHTFGLLLGLTHRIAESDQALRSTVGLTREGLMGNEIHGKTIGLVGLGQIGMRVAALAKAFGLNVLAYDPYLNTEEIEARGAKSESLERLLAQSDVVSLHCPRTPETTGMFAEAQFQSMRKGAIFISTARGGIHDERALYQALKSGHLAGAGLDVWDVEPPPQDNPLLSLANVIATYHTAGVTHQGRERIAQISAEQIIEIAAGGKPARMINPEVYSDVQARLREKSDAAPAAYGVS